MEPITALDESIEFKPTISSSELESIKQLVAINPSNRISKKDQTKKVKQGKLLLVALLENFCSVYDDAKNKKLFITICKQLASMGIIDKEDFLDELASVRSIYKKAFKELIVEAVMALNNEDFTQKSITYKDTQTDEAYIPIQNLNLYSSSAELNGFISSEDYKSNSFDFQPSRFKDEFIISERLGRGAFGTVWKVQHLLDNAYYAIKCIELTHWNRAEYFKLLREVKAHANTNHTHVVRYFASWLDQPPDIQHCENLEHEDELLFDEDISNTQESFHTPKGSSTASQPDLVKNMCLYIQMELCHFTLDQWIKSRNAVYATTNSFHCIRAKEALSIFHQLLKGLKYIYKKKLIHRDLKPMNIYWKSSEDVIDSIDLKNHQLVLDSASKTPGEWKIGDFGLVIEDSEDPLLTRTTRTEYQSFGVGTTLYASPEQLDTTQQLKYTHTTDIYSLGIILFELMHPFKTSMERVKTIDRVRMGVLPEDFVKLWPKESMLILWMTISIPEERPSVIDIIEFDLYTASPTPNAFNELSKACDQCSELFRSLQNENLELKNRIKELERMMKTGS